MNDPDEQCEQCEQCEQLIRLSVGYSPILTSVRIAKCGFEIPTIRVGNTQEVQCGATKMLSRRRACQHSRRNGLGRLGHARDVESGFDCDRLSHVIAIKRLADEEEKKSRACHSLHGS
jgi:hypothetical protein